jgi:hypothetical protein
LLLLVSVVGAIQATPTSIGTRSLQMTPLPTDLTRTPAPATATPTPSPTPSRLMVEIPALQPISSDNVGQMVQLTTLACVVPNSENSDRRRDIFWSPTRNVLAVVMSGKTCLFNLDVSGSLPIEIYANVRNADFSPDGEMLMTTINRNVSFWDVATKVETSSTIQAQDDLDGNLF